MNKLKIYLSGSVKQVNDNFQSWRKECMSIKHNAFYDELEFIDPINYFNYSDNQPKTDKQCLDFFMWLIDKSDVLLVNLDYSDSSCGTCMEIEHAFCNNIPIVSFGERPDTWYNWAETRSTVIFDTLEEAVDYIYMYYGKVVC